MQNPKSTGKMPISIGEVVLVLRGRDKGRLMLVIAAENEGVVYVADGDRRRIARPKRKNLRHLASEGWIDEELATLLMSGKPPSDLDIRKRLQIRMDQEGGEEHGR